jgi:hypothetical protein
LVYAGDGEEQLDWSFLPNFGWRRNADRLHNVCRDGMEHQLKGLRLKHYVIAFDLNDGQRQQFFVELRDSLKILNEDDGTWL